MKENKTPIKSPRLSVRNVRSRHINNNNDNDHNMKCHDLLERSTKLATGSESPLSPQLDTMDDNHEDYVPTCSSDEEMELDKNSNCEEYVPVGPLKLVK